MKSGVFIAIAAYLIWGVSPIYWKFIEDVPAVEIVGYRMVFSFLFVVTVVLLKKGGRNITEIFHRRRSLVLFFLSALLLTINWFVYIWAVNSGHIVDASLGYFINPLVNVLFGVIFLNEKLRTWQWVSVGLAFLGVLYLTIRLSSLPWIGLILAGSFGLYGLIRKKITEGAIHGFTIETGFMFFPALVYLLILGSNGGVHFGSGDISMTLLLVSTGAYTAIPLILFGTAAQVVQLSTLGFIQYITPTSLFLIGIFIFKEAFSIEQMVGYGLIWVALAIFSVEGVYFHRNKL